MSVVLGTFLITTRRVGNAVTVDIHIVTAISLRGGTSDGDGCLLSNTAFTDSVAVLVVQGE